MKPRNYLHPDGFYRNFPPFREYKVNRIQNTIRKFDNLNKNDFIKFFSEAFSKSEKRKSINKFNYKNEA